MPQKVNPIPHWRANLPPTKPEHQLLMRVPVPFVGKRPCVVEWNKERKHYELHFILLTGDLYRKQELVIERFAARIIRRCVRREFGIKHIPNLKYLETTRATELHFKDALHLS